MKGLTCGITFAALASAVAFAQQPLGNSIGSQNTWGKAGMGSIALDYSGTFTLDSKAYRLPEVYTERVQWNAKTNQWDAVAGTKRVQTMGINKYTNGPGVNDCFMNVRGTKYIFRATLTAATVVPPGTVQITVAESIQTMTIP